MQVFRLSRAKHGISLSGKDAAYMGTRWNSIGTEIIYAATNRSLAMAEVAVHFTWATLPPDYMMLTVEIPDYVAIQTIPALDLPDQWNAWPHIRATQKFGDKFVLEGKSCLLRVPSAVVPGHYNLLINPAHADYQRISVTKNEPFPFDKRLMKW